MTDRENDERRAGLVRMLREAADEIEALNAECIMRMNAADVSFLQALANGEAADNAARAPSS